MQQGLTHNYTKNLQNFPLFCIANRRWSVFETTIAVLRNFPATHLQHVRMNAHNIYIQRVESFVPK